MHHARLLAPFSSLLLTMSLLGCNLLPGGGLPAANFGLDITPTTLTQPSGYDWRFHQIGGTQVATQREAHIQRELLAFPATTNWSGGLNLTSFGVGAGDTVTNGMATIFRNSYTNPALLNKVLMLTKAGKLVKVDRTNTADYDVLNLNDTFTKTYITLSPNSSQAYLVADDGDFYVVDLYDATARAMTLRSHIPLGGGGYGSAVTYDPYASNHKGTFVTLYIPTNDGNVHKYIWQNGGLTASAVYPVATGVTQLSSGDATRKVKAPAIVLNQVIYLGDQGGRLNVYNTADTSKNKAFGTGAPINTSPAIEVQDSTSNVVDTATGTRVPDGTPIYAFVNSGVNTFWMNLYTGESSRSISLYTDDFTPVAPATNPNYGLLKNWTYDSAYNSTAISLTDWCTIRTDDDLDLAGVTGNKTRDYITAAEVDAEPGNDGTYAGGPVVCYMLFSTGSTSTAIVKKAEITMRVQKNYVTKIPEFRVSSPYLKGTATLWDYASLTNATRPNYGTTNESVWLGTAENSIGNVQINPGSPGKWDISDAFSGAASSSYGVVMVYNKGNKVLWEYGDKNEDGGNINSTTKHYVTAPEFRTSGADTPTFTVGTSTGGFPSPTLETPPVIDAKNKKVYVFYGNAMYALNYTSTATWMDSTVSTVYCMSNMGRKTTVSGAQYKGASYNNKTAYIGNFTAPVFNYNMTNAYVLDRYPNAATNQSSPTAWDYSLSKFTLPLTSGADGLAGSSTVITNVPGEASSHMVVDFFTNTTTTGGNVFFGLGNGKVYQYDR